ncbi:MAG: dehydrogenase E1 component subunit alpha/beta [Bacteroidetes bacterium]|nr:dehydrogenase E1 component subunit alpha/beta [Bacteroidota bacterium]MCY4233485.1 dehydrogenase E1 component subunit alpha/beta [Bacteroidota bacterium]
MIEEHMLRLIRHNRISKWFSGYGQEAIAVGTTWALNDQDVILPLHRNLGVWTTRDIPLQPLFCQMMGKDGGFTKGRDRTFHFGLPEKRIVGMISHLGAMLPVACGIAQAAQLKGTQDIAVVFCGDGATREGDFHEACSLAGIWKLPIIFIIENNGYGLSTPTNEALPIETIGDAAAGYGFPGITVDGNDLLSVVTHVRKAAADARNGNGPTLLEMKTFRRRGHEEASGVKYVPEELLNQWAQKDPVDQYISLLVNEKVTSTEDIQTMKEEISDAIEVASEYALAQPMVDSSPKLEVADVLLMTNDEPREPSGKTTEIRFIDAITEAMTQSMQDDDSVLLMGQDVAEYGGVFKASAGLLEKFGHARVRNTPIIESGVLGAAMGLSMEGFRPIVEMQYADFISCGFNQIVNNIAKTLYRWNQPINVTIRAPFGGHIGAGPFHSQSMEAWFCHVPGLKVVIPSTPHDAKGLLMASIADPNPVLYFEHKYLYRNIYGPVHNAPYDIPLGVGSCAHQGEDVTVVTYGLCTHWALEHAKNQLKNGISIEVIDLRTLVPLDMDLILDSVKKTGRLLVLHEATMTGGFGGEIAARIAEDGFEFLDAPPMRVAALDTPIPFSLNLETEIFSAKARLDESLERLLAY